MQKLYYIVPFNLNKSGGKFLGTRSKYNSLSKFFDVQLIAPQYSNILFRVLFIIYVEFFMFYIGIFHKKNKNIFFTRGLVGYFATKVLKKTKKNLLIREIHAAPGEYRVIRGNIIKSFLIYLYEKISFFTDISADLRVYNHPYLQEYYKNIKNLDITNDIMLYNGGSEPKNKDTKNFRSLLNIGDNTIILAFTGSVASWHNIEDLLDLQNEFKKHNDDIQIIVGGGRVDTLKNDVINLTPLDEEGCESLILCSDACLMPVSENRISPGSPLKLYQYLLASKPVITQENVIGYSDEVLKYQAGIEVNFKDKKNTRIQIIKFIKEDIYKISDFLNKNKFDMGITWDDRMAELHRVICNHSKIK